jgi:hypothetical protein
MKINLLLFVCVCIVFLETVSQAQIILGPGEEKSFTSEPATGGEIGNNSNFTFNLDGSFDLGTKIIKAQANSLPLVSVGKGEAYSLLYYDFQISETPGTNSNTVGALINYSVFWKGYQEIFSTILSNAIVKVEIIIKDQTANQLVAEETIHDLNVKTYSFMDVIAGGLTLNDTDTKVNTIPAILTRGHTYRLHLKLTTTLLIVGLNQPLAFCDYMDGFTGGGDGRVQLNKLFVKVGLDEKETLQKLAQLDSLESRIDTLEYKLDHHHHIYLTGRGVGQNNTEANTTLSIFDEGGTPGISPPIYNDIPENNIPEENIENKSVPDKFSLGQNYPNPFNPSTVISFAIPMQAFVTVKVYDILGREVKTLMNETKPVGYYEINFNASDLPSGTYIYEIRAGNFVETKKMILLK